MTLSNGASNAHDKTYCGSMKTFLHVTKSLFYSLCECKTTGENFQAFLTCETFEKLHLYFDLRLPYPPAKYILQEKLQIYTAKAWVHLRGKFINLKRTSKLNFIKLNNINIPI